MQPNFVSLRSKYIVSFYFYTLYKHMYIPMIYTCVTIIRVILLWTWWNEISDKMMLFYYFLISLLHSVKLFFRNFRFRKQMFTSIVDRDLLVASIVFLIIFLVYCTIWPYAGLYRVLSIAICRYISIFSVLSHYYFM